MSTRAASWLAWSLAGLSLAAFIADVVLYVLARSATTLTAPGAPPVPPTSGSWCSTCPSSPSVSLDPSLPPGVLVAPYAGSAWPSAS
jgi:hypothetical protein